jgi:AbrB family looped-hinge helix DNA binding protein
MNSKGQIIIPARLRKRYGLKPGTKIRFIERENKILLQPITREYIHSLCGILKGRQSLTKELLKERALDNKREESKLKKPGTL